MRIDEIDIDGDEVRRDARDDKADTASGLVVEFVRGQIERGLLRPGDRLPAERDLATRVGVSRPSVRAGLRTLGAMGVTQTRHGSGTYIADGPPALDSKPLGMLAALHGFTAEQMFEARRVLEMGVAALAAERSTTEQVAAMADEVAGMFASIDDPQAFIMHDVRFHRAIAMASGNPILATLVEMVSSLYFQHRRRAVRTREQMRDVALTHRNIYHAVRARDPERARREMSHHLPRPARAQAADPAKVAQLAMVRAR